MQEPRGSVEVELGSLDERLARLLGLGLLLKGGLCRVLGVGADAAFVVLGVDLRLPLLAELDRAPDVERVGALGHELVGLEDGRILALAVLAALAHLKFDRKG